MKKMTLLVISGLLVLSIISPAVAGIKPDISADLGVYNKYVWRGMVLTDEAVLQPGASLEFMGFGLGIWGNMDLTDINENSSEFNEIDYTLSYGLAVPMFDLNFGLIYYDFPNTTANATTELFVEASAGVILSPSIGIYADIDEIKGTYISLGAGHSIPLNPTLSLDIDAALGLGTKGYTDGYFGVAEITPSTDALSAGVSDFSIGASVSFSVIPMISVTPSVTYATLLGDVKDSKADGEDTDALVIGATASFSF